MIHYGIENVKQEPVSLIFAEGRDFGWSFDVLEPIIITKLGFFNGHHDPILRNVKIYKGIEQIYHQGINVGADTMGFEDIKNNIELKEGRYMITMKSPHGASSYYAEFKNVEFANVGIRHVNGVYENVNDMGWMQTSNCYLVSFEFKLASSI